MSPSGVHDREGTGLSAPIEGADVIANFVASVNRLCADKNYQALKAIVLDNERLRKLLDETQTAYQKNVRELGRQAEERKTEKHTLETMIQDTAKEQQKLKDEKVTAYRKLKAEQAVVAELQKKVTSLEAEVRRLIDNSKKHEEQSIKHQNTITQKNKELKIAEKEAKTSKDLVKDTILGMEAQTKALKTAEDSLSVIRSFMVELTPLGDARESIYDLLGSSFNASADFFRTVLCRDLNGDLLKESRRWDRIKDHSAVQGMIPLPVSNSAPAKQMRAIAGLAVYSRALSEFAFQPMYLSVGNEMRKALSALSGANPEQDAFVRAVLLKALPDLQNKSRDICVERIVENVLSVVAVWVTSDQYEAFKSGLTQLTRDICSKWQHVQTLQERIEPSFTFEAPDDWKPWSIQSILPLANNGITIIAPRSGGKDNYSVSQELERAPLSAANVVKAIWPAFLATSLEQSTDEEPISELVHHGYMLTRADVQSAANEEISRRTIRRTVRETNPATERPRRDSAIFLSRGASDGSDAK